MKNAATPVITPRTKARPKRPRSPDHYPLARIQQIQRWWRKVRFTRFSQKIKTARSNLHRYREAFAALDFETQEISSVLSPMESLRNSSVVSKSSVRTDKTDSRKESSRAAIIQMLDGDSEYVPVVDESTIALKAKISALELERQETSKTLESFKLLSERLKQDMKHQEEDYQRRLERALARQKEDFEDLVTKNITFTEALLAEKEQKNKLLADLQRKLKESELRAEQQMDELRNAQGKELKKNKDAWATAEKLRRDAWEKQRTKEIREQTARGLEPELIRIVNENNQRMEQLKEEHKQALGRQRTDITLEFEENIRKVKESSGRETDLLLEKERETYSKRIRELMDKHESELQTIRRRAMDESADMRKRIESERESDLKAALQKIRMAEDEARRKEKQHESDLVDIREEIARRHNLEIQKLKEQLTIEKEAWVDAQLARNAKDLEAKAKDLRQEMVQQRNAEIHAVISKLGDEHLDTKKLLAQQCDKKLAELKTEHANEVSQYEAMVESLKQKVETEAGAKRALVENLEALGRRIQELEGQNKGINTREDELNRKLLDREAALRRADMDRESAVSLAIDQQKQRTTTAERETQEMKIRLETMERSHQREKERMEQEEASRMEELEEKIKLGVRKKDDTIRKLKEEQQMSQARIKALTEMLERQRSAIVHNA